MFDVQVILQGLANSFAKHVLDHGRGQRNADHGSERSEKVQHGDADGLILRTDVGDWNSHQLRDLNHINEIRDCLLNATRELVPPMP